ncbi:MAG: putative lipoprotein [Geminicoccaceae bacterium]|jgi:DNA-binding beta-propeller fold protein YncE|nr:putative lipoprotein [Geminicoccaceae bacterium]
MPWPIKLAIATLGISAQLQRADASEFLLVPNRDGSTATNGRVSQYDAANGNFVDVLIEPLSADVIQGMTVGPGAKLYISAFDTRTNVNGRVLRYDAETGAFLDVFVEPGAGGLFSPFPLAFGPDGNLHVLNHGPEGGLDGSVLRFDGVTGDVIDVFVENLAVPQDMVFGPDGNLYITSGPLDMVTRHDGTTGNFIDAFVNPGSGGLDGASGLTFGADGNLYVTSPFTDSVFRYDGATGALIDEFVATGAGGLSVPVDLAFGPDGNLYVNTRVPQVVIPGGGAGAVLRYDGQTGEFIDEFVAAGSGGLGITDQGLQFATMPPAIEVGLDIRPESCRNPINRKSRGNLPVAVLDTTDLDVTEVNLDTVLLEGVEPLDFAYEDVAIVSEYSGFGDGFIDLTLKFDSGAIGAGLALAEPGDEATLMMRGEVLNGAQNQGTDSVVIVR